MPVTIKSEREINLMREAGKILSKVHEELAKEVKAGMSSFEIDKICEKSSEGTTAFLLFWDTKDIREAFVFPSMMKWYMGFQAKIKS